MPRRKKKTIVANVANEVESLKKGFRNNTQKKDSIIWSVGMFLIQKKKNNYLVCRNVLDFNFRIFIFRNLHRIDSFFIRLLHTLV